MSSIKCSKCHRMHRSVLAVKICYENGGQEFIRCRWCSIKDIGDAFHTADEIAAERENRRQQQLDEIEVERRQERWYEERGGAYDREDELTRMSEACGTPIPPGFL